MKDRGHASNSAQVASEQEVFISTETTTTEMVSYRYTVNVMTVKYCHLKIAFEQENYLRSHLESFSALV